MVSHSQIVNMKHSIGQTVEYSTVKTIKTFNQSIWSTQSNWSKESIIDQMVQELINQIVTN